MKDDAAAKAWKQEKYAHILKAGFSILLKEGLYRFCCRRLPTMLAAIIRYAVRLAVVNDSDPERELVMLSEMMLSKFTNKKGGTI